MLYDALFAQYVLCVMMNVSKSAWGADRYSSWHERPPYTAALADGGVNSLLVQKSRGLFLGFFTNNNLSVLGINDFLNWEQYTVFEKSGFFDLSNAKVYSVAGNIAVATFFWGKFDILDFTFCDNGLPPKDPTKIQLDLSQVRTR